MFGQGIYCGGGQLLLGCSLDYWHLSMPWSLSAVPFATVLILLGKHLVAYKKNIEEMNLFEMLLLLGLTLYISHHWRLDMCANHIMPILPVFIGAFAGTVMVFVFSLLMERKCKTIGDVFATIGQETYVILAFSQMIIRLENEFSGYNAIIKYMVLAVLLWVIAIIKNKVKHFLQFR